LFGGGEGCAEVYGGGGFADSTFLVSNGDDAGHKTSGSESNLYRFEKRYNLFHVKQWFFVPRGTDCGVFHVKHSESLRICDDWRAYQ